MTLIQAGDNVVQLMTTFISAIIGCMLMALVWFVKRWIGTLDLSIEKLNVTMERINETLSSTERRLDDIDRSHNDHAAALRHLWQIKCPNSDCPYAEEGSRADTPPFFYALEGGANPRRYGEREDA